jgi:IS5 family transposase
MKHQPQARQNSLYDDYFVKHLVPDDHPLLQIDRVVDFSFVRDLVEDLYSPNRGREAIDPELLFRLCFLQIYYDLSDREVIDQAQVNLAFRCFLHLGIEDDLPDPSTLSVFRTRLGADRFRQIFEASIDQARQAGLVGGRRILVDSWGIRMDAAAVRTRPLVQRVVRKAISLLQSLGHEPSSLQSRQAELANDNSWGLTEKLSKKHLAEWLALAEEVYEALEAIEPPSGRAEDVAEMLELVECVIDKQASGSGKMITDVDPDARWSKRERGKKSHPGYKEQSATDEDSEILLGLKITPANEDDSSQLQDLLDQCLQNLGDIPGSLAADSGYHSGQNRQRLADEGIDDFIAAPTPKGHKQGRFSATDFDPDFDEKGRPIRVRCPAGKVADGGKYRGSKSGWSFYFTKSQCEGCPLRDRCSSMKYGRSVFISEYFQLHKSAREREKSEPFQQAQIDRLGIERTFAYQQEKYGMKRVRYRGLDRVSMQVYLAGFVTNAVRMTNRLREGPADGVETAA